MRVYEAIVGASSPLSHRDVCDALPDLDRITVFRNLVTLVDAGLALRVELGDRTWRFSAPDTDHGDPEHPHPHFTCRNCGDVSCLDGLEIHAAPGLERLLADAEIQIRGVCQACR